MKLLITGSAGFIGANFCEYILRNTAHEIIGVDKLTYAACEVAHSRLLSASGYTFYRADIADKAAMNSIFERERPYAVLNFAAESHVDRSIESAEPFIRSNVLGTETLLTCSLRYGIDRFHQISTDEVYGDLPLDSPERFKESSPLAPSSPYSASKAAADLLALSFARTHGLYVTVSRSVNNYGIYQHPEKLIPKIILHAIRGKPFPVYGDGKNIRSWISAKDHARAVALILNEGKAGEIYNVDSGEQFANIDLVELIYSRMGFDRSEYFYTDDRKGHDRKYSVDSQKLRALGFTPEDRLADCIGDIIFYYMKHS